MTSGELRGMRVLGDQLFAFGMALYSVDVYPAEQARIQGVGWGKTSWFGGPCGATRTRGSW